MRRAPLLAAMLLAGCTSLPAPAPWNGQGVSVTALGDNHQYVAALELLKSQSAHQGDYREQRQALLAAAQRYRDELFGEIDALCERSLFAAAQLQLETALPQLPPSPTLRRRTEQFYARRDQFVAAQLEQLARIRGQNLLQEQQLYEKLIGVNGDYEMQVAVERYREDAAYFSRQLHNAGVAALNNGDFDRAVQMLGTANQLHPEKETASHLATAYRQLLAAQNRQHNEREQQRNERYQLLKRQFDHAMAQGDYQSARQHLEAAMELGAFEERIERWQVALQEASDAAVIGHIAEGDRDYAAGNIERALSHWYKADELQPSAEVQSRIERAQRLMARYRELQENPVAQ